METSTALHKRKRGKRGGKKHNKGSSSSKTESSDEQTSSINPTKKEQWVAVAGRAPDDKSIINPHKRRRRGGKRNRKFNESSTEEFIVPNQGANDAVAPTWSALETEWFGLFDKSPLVQQKNIPDPLSLKDVTDNENTPQGHLKKLWNELSRKRQRHTTSSDALLWQPRPIQLQSWSILLPPTTTSTSTTQHRCHNMIGLSPTASGKTLAFGAPMVVAASQALPSPKNSVFGIVLLPTRELAQQVAKELETMIACLTSHKNDNTTNAIRALMCCGGDDQTAQDHIRILQQPSNHGETCQWLISATPGRCWDIIETCQQLHDDDFKNLFKPKYIVLDEADRLAGNSDLGQQVTSILGACMSPTSTSLAFFSATYPHKVQDKWKEWMALSSRACAMIRVDTVAMETSHKRSKSEANENKDEKESSTEICADHEDTSSSLAKAQDDGNDQEETANFSKVLVEPSQITNDFLSSIPACLVQTLHVCAEHKKPKKLVHTLDRIRKEEKDNSARQKRLGIIFFGRIKTLQYVSKLLQQNADHDCLELHSQLPQHVRTKNLQAFQAGKVPILLATDIAARGVHVSNIQFVINYDFPSSLEQYVHRCGRAGRNHQPDPKNRDNLPPTIYSFFTRSMAPMAPDTVALLKASKAWVDPNLVALANETGERSSNPKKKRITNNSTPGESKPSNRLSGEADKATKDGYNKANDLRLNDDSDSDAYPELSAKKIVLKRAGHVSDASSDSGECSDDEI